MKNITMTEGTNPLGIRITGSEEYVRNELDHLQDFMNNVEDDREQTIRNDYEH